ncbi:Response regulator of zinc sigma-54-dependent two-component system [Chitinispirillum alkaliphilum]|nr:Response regulator of zinc sigma-54-dependent two-component system [Chitinispirillum alkaliphilum]
MTPKLVDKQGNAHLLKGRIITIGSSKNCQIKINKCRAFIAHLLFTKGSFLVQKLDSEISIKVNGSELNDEKKLKNGDLISFGNQEFVFDELGDDMVYQDFTPHVGEPVVELIKTIVFLLKDKKQDLFSNLLCSISRLLHCDAARLVAEGSEGSMKTVARYPLESGLDRFSNRAIDWARERGKTVLAQDEDWCEDTNSCTSLKRNYIASVMCSPLYQGEKVLGYLYLDRLQNNIPFCEKDRDFCDVLIPLFSEILSNFDEKRRQKETIERLQKANLPSSCSIIYECERMVQVIELVKRQARTNSPVLVLGETGTGKEFMAKLIHEYSSRSSKAFKIINCGAIPENLIESELFGYEKGAFTGATQKKTGLFESANGGTVVLDEIGEMPLQLQVRLLRVLQESEIIRVGGTETVKVDVRIVAMTNRNLETEVKEKRFRQDLFFRLNVLTIEIPPLRERGADITLLADYFNNKYSLQFGLPVKTISVSARNALLTYDWPGNIREMENVIQKAILLSGDNRIEREHLHFAQMGENTIIENTATLRDARIAAEKDAIVSACNKSKGNISLAAKILDIDRKWLMKKMQEYGISADEFRS